MKVIEIIRSVGIKALSAIVLILLFSRPFYLTMFDELPPLMQTTVYMYVIWFIVIIYLVFLSEFRKKKE